MVLVNFIIVCERRQVCKPYRHKYRRAVYRRQWRAPDKGRGHAQHFLKRDAAMFNECYVPLRSSSEKEPLSVLFHPHTQSIPVVYCFTSKKVNCSIFAPCRSVASVTSRACRLSGVWRCGCWCNRHAKPSAINAAVDVWFIQNGANQPVFAASNIGHRVIKVCVANVMPARGNRPSPLSASRSNGPQTPQSRRRPGCADNVRAGHFRGQRYFGDHIGIGAICNPP